MKKHVPAEWWSLAKKMTCEWLSGLLQGCPNSIWDTELPHMASAGAWLLHDELNHRFEILHQVP